MHADLPTLAFFADQVCSGDAAIFEDQIVGSGSTDAHLLFMNALGEARGILFDHEQGDALQALGLIGDCENNIGRSSVAVGDEALGAVQNVFVAVLHSSGLLARSVGASAGFGQTECAQLAAGSQIRDPLHLLFFGTESHDGAHAQRGMSSHDGAGSQAALAQLFDSHDIHQVVAACAAVLLRNGNTQEAVTCQLGNSFPREAFFFVDFSCQRFQFVVSELYEHFTSHFMFFAHSKVHI